MSSCKKKFIYYIILTYTTPVNISRKIFQNLLSYFLHLLTFLLNSFIISLYLLSLHFIFSIMYYFYVVYWSKIMPVRLTLRVVINAFFRFVEMAMNSGSRHVYKARPDVILRTMWWAAALILFSSGSKAKSYNHKIKTFVLLSQWIWRYSHTKVSVRHTSKTLLN